MTPSQISNMIDATIDGIRKTKIDKKTGMFVQGTRSGGELQRELDEVVSHRCMLETHVLGINADPKPVPYTEKQRMRDLQRINNFMGTKRFKAYMKAWVASKPDDNNKPQ